LALGDGHRATGHRIYLLRHAKSSWDDPLLADHDRPLAPRGRRATARLKRHARRLPVPPQLVLCSSAVRAVQTWEGVRGGFPSDIRVEISGDLYAADALVLRDRLERLREPVEAVLVIGHNPAIEGLAVGLAGGGDEAALERMQAKFPTGGLATLAFDGAWSALSWDGAVVREFVVPRDLR
jgi:phosphohistidine phosphatase